jgi:hypothetical protein
MRDLIEKKKKKKDKTEQSKEWEPKLNKKINEINIDGRNWKIKQIKKMIYIKKATIKRTSTIFNTKTKQNQLEMDETGKKI